MVPLSGIRFTKDDLLTNYWGLVDASIKQFGNKEFIVTKNGSVTFFEATARAEWIRHKINQSIPGKQAGVGIFLWDPREVIPCMIGVLKAGCYFIVMDVTFPGPTLMDMIRDAGIRIILTSKEYLSNIQSLLDDSITVIDIGQIDDTIVTETTPVEYSPEDIVQIMFTSGSTGKPKGAIEDYRYLTRAVRVKLETYVFNEEDKILQLSSFTFSGHHIFVFTALLVGLTICYHPVKIEGFSKLPAWIREMGITIFTSTPTTFRSILSVLKPEDTFPLIHTFYLGGEKRLRNDILAVKKHFPNVKWVRINYSGTEMQMVTSSLVSIDKALENDLLPSGKPCDDLRVLIWDTAGNELGPGQEGEIVIYGDGLARGYINNAELTSQKFLQDLKSPHWQYFKTGDLGKILPDGQLMHLGRIDNMIKIKGVRIELDHIENLISSYPGVIHVASKVFEDDKGIKRLATYYTVEEGIHIPVSDLRRHLAAVIPMQQVPSYFIPLDKLPSTPTGKVDYEKLPIPSLTRPPLDYPYRSASSVTEQKLVSIWEEQIGISGIGVSDDFFDLGGDSLIGAVIFSEIESVFGISLPVSTLLTTQNIRSLAGILDGKTSIKPNPPIITINQGNGEVPIFFIPGKGGYPIRIKHLARRLDQDIPLHAFQNPVENNDVSAYESIDQIASVFVKSLLQVTPGGECFLVGESSGGKIAYEIAQQITRKGMHPPVVFLLDTFRDKEVQPDFYQNGNNWLYYRMIVKKHISIWFRSSWAGKKEYLNFYSQIFRGTLSKLFNHQKSKLRGTMRSSLPEKNQRIEDNLVDISRKYKIKPYPGQVVLVMAIRGIGGFPNAYGWDKVGIKNLVVEHLDCYHGSMLFEPAVTELAKIIKSRILAKSVD